MKANFSIFAVIILLGFCLAGCKKDSIEAEPEPAANYLKVGETDYDISKGIIEDFGLYNGSFYRFILKLVSQNITIQEINGSPDSVSGIGNVIYISLISKIPGKLSLGDYLYDQLSGVSQTFYFFSYTVNWDTSLPPDHYVRLKSGTVKVIQNNEEYKLSFSGIDWDNNVISGYFKGKLTYYKFN
jgi:hypothetical protein